ncbi:Ubox domain containing protein [Acanthamoeba castellanii str. Neff]|uniref:Ubox domain containing protein n=1 Tax=Acanthamoeba castellanii (strain ATCC 30010 / Neff) TaxID=1257118 RepID=L8GZS8_ACACF|nr:Ubox domain containing protein [Acanthamoeba castellanii str. Neff]ELR17586.1 Ubox domain containing protein [Acanthamoeba castellanii str. Neff]
MSLTGDALEAAVRRLLREFGNQLDREVLESVLEICGGDVDQTVAFLRVQNDTDYVDPGPQQKESIPKDYMDKPPGYAAPKAGEGDTSSAALRLKKVLLSGEAGFEDHLTAVDKVFPEYTAVLLMLLHKNVELSTVTKSRVLAACWQLRKHELADHLVSLENHFNIPEVLKALKILDGPRRLRALEKKIARLEKQATAKPKTLGLLRAKINDLKKDVPGVETQLTSVSGALAKRVKKWTLSLSKENLDFYALQLPKEPWQELADLVHLHPSDFQLPWFLSFVFGHPAPEDSLVVQAQKLTPENAEELVTQYKFPYSFLRKNLPDMSLKVKAQVALYEKLDTLVWYYEELSSNEVDAIIAQRIDAGEEPNFSYGKLMERLLYFKMNGIAFYHKLVPVAQKRLKDIFLPLEPPVVVMGDASYSMDIAIRTATIIGSLLAALTKADLLFFNVKSFTPKTMPRTIEDVLECATSTPADGLTAPACALWDYYQKKTVVKFFIAVTDEIENEKSKGEYFAQLFYKYYTEVYPAKIVFVSFLENPGEKGRMVKSLENLGIVPLQFRLDSHRPDLTKVDTLLGLLASECSFFPVQVDAVAQALRRSECRLAAALEQMKDLPFPDQPLGKQGGEDEEEEGKGKQKAKAHDDNEPPEEFLCPITQELMKDPVVASDGHTYEKLAIEEWIQKKAVSPMTNGALEGKLYPNFSLKSRIAEWKQTHNAE